MNGCHCLFLFFILHSSHVMSWGASWSSLSCVAKPCVWCLWRHSTFWVSDQHLLVLAAFLEQRDVFKRKSRRAGCSWRCTHLDFSRHTCNFCKYPFNILIASEGLGYQTYSNVSFLHPRTFQLPLDDFLNTRGRRFSTVLKVKVCKETENNTIVFFLFSFKKQDCSFSSWSAFSTKIGIEMTSKKEGAEGS